MKGYTPRHENHVGGQPSLTCMVAREWLSARCFDTNEAAEQVLEGSTHRHTKTRSNSRKTHEDTWCSKWVWRSGSRESRLAFSSECGHFQLLTHDCRGAHCLAYDPRAIDNLYTYVFVGDGGTHAWNIEVIPLLRSHFLIHSAFCTLCSICAPRSEILTLGMSLKRAVRNLSLSPSRK